jgi:hypothetical protein
VTRWQRFEVLFVPGVAQQSVRPTADGRANGDRGFALRVGRLRRPNPRLDPTGLRPAAQPRSPLGSHIHQAADADSKGAFDKR